MFLSCIPVGMTLPAACFRSLQSLCCAVLGGLWLHLLPVTWPILHLLAPALQPGQCTKILLGLHPTFLKSQFSDRITSNSPKGKGDLKAKIAAGRQDSLSKQDRATEIWDPYQKWLIPELSVKLCHAHFRAQSSPGQGMCGPWEQGQSWPELCKRSD